MQLSVPNHCDATHQIYDGSLWWA